MYLEELLGERLLLRSAQHVDIALVQVHHAGAAVGVGLHAHQPGRTGNLVSMTSFRHQVRTRVCLYLDNLHLPQENGDYMMYGDEFKNISLPAVSD